MGTPSGGDVAEAALTVPVPDIGEADELGMIVLALLAAVVVVFVVVPLLLFGIELLLLGLVVAAGIFGRTLLGRPWVVQADPLDGAGHELGWRVVGWRRSGRLIDEVTTALEAGLNPALASGVTGRADRH